eukprot:1161669-Pelagomonas_calceolata.AAC.9
MASRHTPEHLAWQLHVCSSIADSHRGCLLHHLQDNTGTSKAFTDRSKASTMEVDSKAKSKETRRLQALLGPTLLAWARENCANEGCRDLEISQHLKQEGVGEGIDIIWQGPCQTRGAQSMPLCGAHRKWESPWLSSLHHCAVH